MRGRFKLHKQTNEGNRTEDSYPVLMFTMAYCVLDRGEMFLGTGGSCPTQIGCDSGTPTANFKTLILITKMTRQDSSKNVFFLYLENPGHPF